MTTTKAPGVKHTIDELTDDGLARVLREYRRAIEDGPRGKQGHVEGIHRIRQLQKSRLRLKMRYGAVDNHVGTDIYDHYYRLNHAPTYRLAAHMDYLNWQGGRASVLMWETAA